MGTTTCTPPAGRLDPGVEIQRLQKLVERSGSGDDLRPRHAGTRIQIPHEAVRPLDVVGGGIPGVDLDDAHLRKSDHRAEGIRDEILADLGLLLDADTPQRRRSPRLRMTEERAGPGDSGRAMHERQRAAAHVRQDPVANRLVVARELKLRQTQFGVNRTIRVRDMNAGDDGARLCGRAALSRATSRLATRRPRTSCSRERCGHVVYGLCNADAGETWCV